VNQNVFNFVVSFEYAVHFERTLSI